MMRALVPTAAALILAAATAAPAGALQVAPGAPVTVDGPGSAVQRVSGMSIARDGTGGLVYLKQAGGATHVFVSRLLGGSFQAPEELDGSLGGSSSQAVVAAGNGGVLLVAFVNGGTLYVVDRLSPSGAPSAPIPLAGGASGPAIQMSNFGKAYLAFALDAGGGSHDVRAAYYYKGHWALESAPLDANPADDAGSGAGRPAVVAAGDGVGIVVWGEAGHIYSRRVWGTAPSVVYEQADVPSVSGFGELTSDSPAAAAGGDSSYVDVEFREEVSNGVQQQSRVLMRRLRGSQYDGGFTSADGLGTPALDGADQPQIALGEYTSGVATAARDVSNNVWATVIDGTGLTATVEQLNSLPNSGAPYAVPAMAGLYSDLVAWQHASGLGAEIRVRYADDGENFGPELVLSSPSQGSTDAADGLVAAGDVDGDAAVAWIQGSGSSTRVMAAELYRAPGSIAATRKVTYSRSRHPVLSWSAAGRWGPIRYQVTVDGHLAGTTTATAFTVPRALSDGQHRWQVSASNPAGEQSTAPSARVWIDTVAPSVKASVRGTAHAGRSVTAHLSYHDRPKGEDSGVGTIMIHWGDHTVSHLHSGAHTKSHAYRRAGRFKVTIVVEDRAGNQTVVVRYVRIR